MKPCVVIILIILIFACGRNPNVSEREAESINASSEHQPPQLNITLLLDLSDRIDTTKSYEKPEHYKRDIEIVKYFTELFVKDMEKRGTFLAKGKIKVIFSPKPNDPNVNIFAEKLSIDLSSMSNQEKKAVHDNMIETFHENLSKIYKATLSERKWIGSDIWRFFKNDVKDYTIETNKQYRNILVLITDGYVYHSDSKGVEGNRYAYLLPENIREFNLRNNPAWEEEITKQNFGLVTKRNDLKDLEILVLEVCPSPAYKNDEDVIKTILTKWFQEMGVKRFGIFNSDLPEYTKQRISDFIR